MQRCWHLKKTGPSQLTQKTDFFPSSCSVTHSDMLPFSDFLRGSASLKSILPLGAEQPHGGRISLAAQKASWMGEILSGEIAGRKRVNQPFPLY